MFSGGLGSWAAAKRVVQQHGAENTILLWCDTMMEDEDLYRFVHEAASNVGAELVRIADGRDPWQVFFDERFLGNSRFDPCSRILKRHLADKWIANRFDPSTCTRYVGIDWSEYHRFERLRDRLQPWKVLAPLCDPPYLTKKQMADWLSSEGIKLPRLYEMGFDHNNCGGFCIKAGQAHFRRLLETMPERYAYHERKEQDLRDYLNADVSILQDRKNGTNTPITLKVFRERTISDAGSSCDKFDFGGCGCFAGEDEGDWGQQVRAGWDEDHGDAAR
jgi:hypothetical protein